MATRTLTYAAKATITWTGTSIASAAARASTVVDNTTNKYIDALVRVKSNGIAGSTSTLDFYVYTALSDTSYTDGATGTDAAFTAANRKNAIYLGSLTLSTTTQQVGASWSVASKFGGIMPSKWGVIGINNSGAALSATAGDHVIEYEGITETIA